MAGKTPREAYENFRDPLNEALGCITAGRLTVPDRPDFRTGQVYALVLGQGDPVLLKRRERPRIFLSVGHHFRIVTPEVGEEYKGPFKTQTVAYWYSLATGRGEDELLSYHWTPETTQVGERLYPHLHIKPRMVRGATVVSPDRIGKLHIPTGRVSLESVIRFAIDELNIAPLSKKKDWRSVLDRTEAAFDRYRRREMLG